MKHQRNIVIFYMRAVTGLTLAMIILFSCQREPVAVESSAERKPISSTQALDTDQQEIIETVERLLFAAGNSATR